jgi:hypothetical protein
MGWDGLIPQGILFIDENLRNNLITLGLLIDRSAAAGSTTASDRSES